MKCKNCLKPLYFNRFRGKWVHINWEDADKCYKPEPLTRKSGAGGETPK